MSTATLASDSPATVQAAIEANMAKRQTAEAHLAGLRDRRAVALLDPKSPKQIAELETEIRQTELTIERLEAVRPQLEVQLHQAEAAVLQASVDQAIEQAGDAVERFRSALAGYADHAAAIVAICRLNQEALAAVTSAQRLTRSTGQTVTFDVPGGAGGLSFHQRLMLPWVPGSGMMWGKVPSETIHNIYSNQPVVR